jgi:hypothetical protein
VLLALFILLRLASDRVGVAAQAPSAGVTEVAMRAPLITKPQRYPLILLSSFTILTERFPAPCR